jgi:Ni/Co efflux regulator RcnB
MKSKALVCALAAVSLAVGQLAFAQDGGDRTGHDRADQLQRNLQQDGRHINEGGPTRDRAYPSQRNPRQDGRRSDDGGSGRDRIDPSQRYNQQESRRRDDHREGYANGGWRTDERGAGPEHRFHRGDRLPREYRSNQYVVDDWRGHQLSAPPRGYHWVQTGGDYVLVAIATGVILQLLLDH